MQATARRWALNTLLDLLDQDYVQRMYDNLKEGKYVLQRYYEGTGKYVVVFLSLNKFIEGMTRAGEKWRTSEEYDNMNGFRVKMGKRLAELGQELQQQQIRVVDTMSDDEEEDEKREKLLKRLQQEIQGRMVEEVRLHTERTNPTGEGDNEPVYNKIGWCNQEGYISSLPSDKVTHTLWRLIPLIPWLSDKVTLADEQGKFRVAIAEGEQKPIRHEIRMDSQGIKLTRKTGSPGTTNIPWKLGQNKAVFGCLREMTAIQSIDRHGISMMEDGGNAMGISNYRTQLMLRIALESTRGMIEVPSDGYYDCPDQGDEWERYANS